VAGAAAELRPGHMWLHPGLYNQKLCQSPE